MRKFAEATGWKRHLYTVTGLEPERQGIMEDQFFRQTDQRACDALAFMISNRDGTADMPATLRSGWSRFIASLKHRNPEGVELLRWKCRAWVQENLVEMKARFDAERDPADPGTFAEMRARIEHNIEHETWAVLLEDVINSKVVGTFINAMRWSLVTLPHDGPSILTSDRPLYMTNGIEHPEGHIILPVGPRQVFVAVNTPDMERSLRGLQPRQFVRELNDRTVRSAHAYVYATDDSQLRFVANRMGKAST